MRIERFTTPAPLRRTFGAFRTWEACYSSLPPFSGGATRPKTEPLTSLSPPRVRRSAMICRTVRARPPRLHSPRARERRAARAIRDAFHRTAIVSSSRRESIRPDRCHRSHDFAAVARCCDACSLPAVSPDAFTPMLYRESLCPRPRDRCPPFERSTRSRFSGPERRRSTSATTSFDARAHPLNESSSPVVRS